MRTFIRCRYCQTVIALTSSGAWVQIGSQDARCDGRTRHPLQWSRSTWGPHSPAMRDDLLESIRGDLFNVLDVTSNVL
jgi:hypothetical protein